MEQNIWMFADDYLDIPEIRNIETKSYEETERKKLEVRGKALKTIQNVFGKEGIFVFSKVQCPKAVGEVYVVLRDDCAFMDVLCAYRENKVNLDFVRDFIWFF